MTALTYDINLLTTTTTPVLNGTVVEKIECSALSVDSKAMKSSGGDFGTLLWPILLNIVQLFVAVLVLVLLMRSRRAKEVLVPKREAGHRRGDPVDWIRKAFAVDMEKNISIDGRVVVRLCLLGFKFSATGTAVGICLSTMFWYHGTQRVGTLQFSISNLATTQQSTLVVSCIVAASYIYTLTFVWLMRAEWRNFIVMRQTHFAKRARGELGIEAAQAQVSLMVERIPKNNRGTKQLTEFFTKMFGGRIHSCRLHRDTLMLYHLKALQATSESVSCLCRCCRASVEKNMERMVRLENEIVQRARQTESTFTGLALDGQVNPEELLQLFKVNNKAKDGTAVDEAENEEAGAQLLPTSTGFVTLKRAAERTLSEQVILFSAASSPTSYDDWVVMPAPEPRAIIWENLGVPYAQTQLRNRLGAAICFFGVTLWSFPVAGVQWLFSEEGLRSWFPGSVEFLRKHAMPLYHIILGYLPVLALVGLITLLPYALRILGMHFENRKTKTELARSVLFRNFMFQFFSLWLTVFSSSIADSFQEVIDHPGCAQTILGTSIPKVSLYFTQFVIARIGISLPLLLIRIAAIIQLLTKQKPEPAYCLFETEMTNIAIVFVIGSMYCVVAPLIMPACMIYFGFAFGIYKWLFVHVYEIEFDCAGELWYSVFNGLIGGMVFGMLSVCGLMTIYASEEAWAYRSMYMLPMGLIYFAYDCEIKFGRIARVLPYEDAVQIDEGMGIDESKFSDQYYVDPILMSEADKAKQYPLNSVLESSDSEGAHDEDEESGASSSSSDNDDHKS